MGQNRNVAVSAVVVAVVVVVVDAGFTQRYRQALFGEGLQLEPLIDTTFTYKALPSYYHRDYRHHDELKHQRKHPRTLSRYYIDYSTTLNAATCPADTTDAS